MTGPENGPQWAREDCDVHVAHDGSVHIAFRAPLIHRSTPVKKPVTVQTSAPVQPAYREIETRDVPEKETPLVAHVPNGRTSDASFGIFKRHEPRTPADRTVHRKVQREVVDHPHDADQSLPAKHHHVSRFNYVSRLRNDLRYFFYAIRSTCNACTSPLRNRLHALEAHTNKRVRIGYEVGRFLTTFSFSFAVLFLALNFRSYYQIMRASLLPHANLEAKIALQMITNPLLSERLREVPELPVAGAGETQAPSVVAPGFRFISSDIGINAPIVTVSDAALRRKDWDQFKKDVENGLQNGVVHYPGTAVPGQIGNAFFTAHSSQPPWYLGKYGDIFALLPSLEIGDEYSIIYKGNVHTYRIEEKFEVFPSDVTVLDQPDDRLMSTLMTCTPIGTNFKRLILRGREIDARTGDFIVLDTPKRGEDTVDTWGKELVAW